MDGYPLGTDFPVEDISPFKTFYAAVVPKRCKRMAFQRFSNGKCIDKGRNFTWYDHLGSKANFEETEKGSLEKENLLIL
jgi:predicted amidohydrolase YtcJ